MRLNILFLKRKYIYYFFILILTITLLFIYLFTRQFKEIETMTIVSKEKAIKDDFDGDGENELLHINSDDNKYSLYISKGDTIFPLEPTDKTSLISEYKDYFPMRISLIDVNRDKLPEIFIQGSVNDSPAVTSFANKDGKYEPIFESGSNIIGVLDTSTDRTPLFYYGKFNEKGLNIKENILLFNNLKATNRELEENIAGIDIISSFIDYMQTIPYISSDIPANLDSHLLDSYDYSTISKLHSSGVTFNFLDAFFQDNTYSNDGILNSVKWSLTFRTTKINENKPSGYAIVNLLLEKDEGKNFKLSSISIEEK